MRAEPKEKTVTRATGGENANTPPPLAKNSERITAKTENVRVFGNLDNQNIASVYFLKIRFILVYIHGNKIYHWKENLTMHNVSAKCAS